MARTQKREPKVGRNNGGASLGFEQKLCSIPPNGNRRQRTCFKRSFGGLAGVAEACECGNGFPPNRQLMCRRVAKRDTCQR
jgi:hypothetical protein